MFWGAGFVSKSDTSHTTAGIVCCLTWCSSDQASVRPGRFRGPSGRAPFSDEGGFTFSEAPFEGTLHEGLKGASPSEGFKGASPSEGGLEGGFKGA